jgi:hypothetical protein
MASSFRVASRGSVGIQKKSAGPFRRLAGGRDAWRLREGALPVDLRCGPSTDARVGLEEERILELTSAGLTMSCGKRHRASSDVIGPAS